jgi:nicotinamide riboside kinase
MVEKKLRIVLTGPESTGKTTLAKALAAALKGAWVPEFARPYLQYIGRTYQIDDLPVIQRGQAAWETWYQTQVTDNQLLILDTDWTVMHIWHLEKTGIGWPEAPADIAQRQYLLCAPDIEWQPDPLREHPTERERLFVAYERLLQSVNARYKVVEGDEDTRLATALAWLGR